MGCASLEAVKPAHQAHSFPTCTKGMNKRFRAIFRRRRKKKGRSDYRNLTPAFSCRCRRSSGIGAGAIVPISAAAMMEAPPADAELTGMGALPFVWYSGVVPDLEMFGDGVPLETDEVASAPDVRCPVVPAR